MPDFGVIIIGDELLTGKRKDTHLAAVIERLSARGLELNWARYLGDDYQRLVNTFKQSFASNDIVFSFGGIGATPDDKTRQAAGDALGLELEAHSEGLAELDAQFGPEVTPQRRKLVEYPVGSRIIPNPINRVAGFSFRQHHFVPGFPKMSWPMVEWVLDNEYAHLHQAQGAIESIVRVYSKEGVLIPLLEQYTERYPALRLSCLPRADLKAYEVELAFRGEASLVETAMAELQVSLSDKGFRWASVK